MSDNVKHKDLEKNKQKPRRSLDYGCAVLTLTFICVLCWGMTAIGLAPEYVYTFPERFLPPYCDRVLFAELVENPPSTMRVIKDLYGQTRVIAVDESGQDICFFRGSTHRSSSFSPAISPDKKYLAFTSNQFIADYEVVHHLFIVNGIDGSYTWFNPDKADERIEKLAWSPDSQSLATISFNNSFCCVPTAHINLMTPMGEYIWRMDTEVGYLPSWGVLLWSEGGEQIYYRHEDTFEIGTPVGLPFSCTVHHTGIDLQCEFSDR